MLMDFLVYMEQDLMKHAVRVIPKRKKRKKGKGKGRGRKKKRKIRKKKKKNALPSVNGD